MMKLTLKSTTAQYLQACILALGLVFISLTVEAENKVTLTLENADVRELIRWAQDITRKTIIIHPNVKGKVTVIAGDPMTEGEAYQVFLSALQVHGFSVVETATSVKIIPDALAKQSAIPMFADSGNDAEEMVVQIIKVKNIAATQLINILRPLVPQVGHLAAYPTTNALIIADRASNIQKIMRIVREIDQVGGVEIEVITLEFASAKEVLAVIQKLIPGTQGKGGNSNTLGIKIAADERSNSILLSGDPAMRLQIRNLAHRLDQPLAGNGNTQVYFLNYATATDIAPILESMSGSVQRGDKNQKAESVEFSIQANDALNAIIVTAPPSLQNTIKGVIAELDIRRPQVLVEALIVEIDQASSTEIGIEWQTASSSGNVGGSVSAPAGGLTRTLSQITKPQNLAAGLTLGYFTGGDISAVINALAGEANANILSTPTIMALDNQEASILVGENVPFITGNQNRPGDVNSFQTVERKDIGIVLKIKPRINNDNSVSLDIEQSVESIGETDAQTADIITKKREIKTRVIIDNDQVLVLGGLIKDEVIESEKKVPFLGDIPILGHLFKSTISKTVKRNLMVFIRPTIIYSRKAGQELTRKRYEYMRGNQEDFRDNIHTYFLPSGGETPYLPEMGLTPHVDEHAQKQKQQQQQQ